MRIHNSTDLPQISRRTKCVLLPICFLVPWLAACERQATPSGAEPDAVVYVAPVKADITPQEAKALLDGSDGHVYLDVRTVAEFTAGHVPGAINIPYLSVNASGERGVNANFLEFIQATLAKDAKILVGCQSGGRSKRAQSELQDAGYSRVSNVVGGFGGKMLQPGWSSLDYAIETGDGGENSYAAIQAKATP